jgi:hypothetical protein
MRNADRLSGLFWAGVALLICWGSFRLSLGDLHHPGPGFFSFLAGTLLGLFSIILFWQSSRKGPQEERKGVGSPLRTGQMIWMVIALIIYVLGMKYVGFFFSTILFLGFLLRGIGRQKWPVTISVTILAAIISHLIFQYWLDVQLPRGFLGF